MAATIIQASFTLAFIRELRHNGFSPGAYSGRGMGGKLCVCVKNTTAWKVAVSLSPQFAAQIPEPHIDQLGKGIVLYWPSIPFYINAHKQDIDDLKDDVDQGTARFYDDFKAKRGF